MAQQPNSDKQDSDSRSGFTFEETSTNRSNGMSPAQLRLQAQGALLGLASQNIRFQELVSEGINPEVLRRLYDEIGLKVPPIVHIDTSQKKQGIADRQPKTSILANSTHHTLNPENHQKETLTNQPEARLEDSEQPQSPNEKASRSKIQDQASNKPLERKDVIARMLAAKAAKASTDNAEVQPPTDKLTQELPAQVQSTTTSTSSDTTKPHAETPFQKSAEAKAKEKNKAQTELARQRIEQLKRQGLPKSQLKPQEPTSSPVESGPSNGLQPPIQSNLQHPLPDRPPEKGTASSRIPGLFMTASEPTAVQEQPQKANEGVVADDANASALRVHRKRPRASDFEDDETSIPPRKQSGLDSNKAAEHKVIIDISDDDESMYGSDDGQIQGTQLPSNQLSHHTSKQQPVRDAALNSDLNRKNSHSHQSTPVTSSAQTPGKVKEEAELRSEILAMHRKIAELEKKRKDKQEFSQPQSPGLLGHDKSTVSEFTESRGQLVSTPMENQPDRSHLSKATPTFSPEVDVHVRNSRPVTGFENSDLRSANAEERQRRQSTLSRSSLDPSKIEQIHQKFIRKKEIESGLPLLEAELVKSEAKLAKFEEEMQKLHSEIAKGKAGKQRLIDELQELGVETAGLTLEELQETKERISGGVLERKKDEREYSFSFSVSFMLPSTQANAVSLVPEIGNMPWKLTSWSRLIYTFSPITCCRKPRSPERPAWFRGAEYASSQRCTSSGTRFAVHS